jgi:nitrogen fixation NifU-like protein
MLTGELRGMTLEEVRELDRDDVLDMLGVEVTPMRVKCAVLAEKVAQDGTEIHLGEKDVEKTKTE